MDGRWDTAGERESDFYTTTQQQDGPLYLIISSRILDIAIYLFYKHEETIQRWDDGRVERAEL